MRDISQFSPTDLARFAGFRTRDVTYRFPSGEERWTSPRYFLREVLSPRIAERIVDALQNADVLNEDTCRYLIHNPRFVFLRADGFNACDRVRIEDAIAIAGHKGTDPTVRFWSEYVRLLQMDIERIEQNLLATPPITSDDKIPHFIVVRFFPGFFGVVSISRFHRFTGR